jgi:hypothetical protein
MNITTLQSKMQMVPVHQVSTRKISSPRNSQPSSTPKCLMKIEFDFSTRNTAYT